MQWPGRNAILWAFACCACVASASGQQDAQFSHDPPGVWYEGAFYGYRGGRGGCHVDGANSWGCGEEAALVGSGAPCADVADAELLEDEFADGGVEELEGCDFDPVPDSCALTDCPRLIYGHAEYLLWWSNDVGVPALATTSASGTADNVAGVLGLGSTSVLLDGDLHAASASGGRFTLGTWLNAAQESAVEATFLFLAEDRDGFLGSQAEFPILARPFFNVQLGANDARLVAFPGLIRGTLEIDSRTSFQNMSIGYRRVMRRDSSVRWDVLAGYRFGHLEDQIEMRESTTALSGPEAGATRVLSDRFSSEAHFHGGELGVMLLRPVAPLWTLDASARVGLGVTQRRARIAGETVVTTAGGSATTAGGLLTQQSNLGRRSESDFGATSEFSVTLQRRISRSVKASVGYSFLLWSDVWRAGEQIDLSLNPTQIPPSTLVGAARPSFPATESSFWTQGLRLGVEATY